jgi:exosortase D (VPLPA-CTERM-specific)
LSSISPFPLAATVSSAGQVQPVSCSTWTTTPAAWGLLAVAFTAILIANRSGLAQMLDWMLTKPEYGHGLLMPFTAAFLVWQRSDRLRTAPFIGSWWGVSLIILGAALGAVGELSSVFTLEHYAAMMMLFGMLLALTGAAAFRMLWVPLLVLVFMIPLPEFLYRDISAELQLLSSEIGVWVVRCFGVAVYLEGNVIDLGAYRLQVAEACSGLRYLFPLMTIGFVMAFFFKTVLWKRALLFLSSIPITILMNSLRIGIIGVTVEHWGVEMAEGFLHEFQGWVVFMVSGALMLLEMILLTLIGSDRRPWKVVFGLELPSSPPKTSQLAPRPIPTPFKVSIGLLLSVAVASFALPHRAEAIPDREQFAQYPSDFGGWIGQRDVIERIYLDELQLDDYYLADFTRTGSAPINFYMAWYNSQRAGRSAHSPRSCLPGGGWRIDSLTQVTLPQTSSGGRPLTVNRVVIRLGNERQLVYYWFQQRGRLLTNEYAVKWYLFWDALTRNRTDGALIRLVAPLPRSGRTAEIDAELAEFAATIVPLLPPYVPS